ncbi:MAG: flagellar biosynthesis anti-sigma factor FlgM [Spirochaetia bacterium]
MTIEGLGPVDPISKHNKTEKTSRPQKAEKSDSINVSEEAKNMGELYKAAESVKSSPDVRAEKIAEIKEKLKDPSYIDDKVIESVADSIMEMFEI